MHVPKLKGAEWLHPAGCCINSWLSTNMPTIRVQQLTRLVTVRLTPWEQLESPSTHLDTDLVPRQRENIANSKGFLATYLYQILTFLFVLQKYRCDQLIDSY